MTLQGPLMAETGAVRLEWFKKALLAILGLAGLESIAFPYEIGCGLAGGHWPDYLLALEAFAEEARAKGVKVVIYRLPPSEKGEVALCGMW